ncbi:hypothetical protein GGX14DRAFT_405378 [Mycena pura]|uniref:Uncharacterized protein n=1 Tax=Mycena pura TaxID=153505 RepID=A0AAD6UW97_9AGAR|nr:hypothetical protein GGX14DRAFT_405378 [Mycena pura]
MGFWRETGVWLDWLLGQNSGSTGSSLTPEASQPVEPVHFRIPDATCNTEKCPALLKQTEWRWICEANKVPSIRKTRLPEAKEQNEAYAAIKLFMKYQNEAFTCHYVCPLWDAMCHNLGSIVCVVGSVVEIGGQWYGNKSDPNMYLAPLSITRFTRFSVRHIGSSRNTSNKLSGRHTDWYRHPDVAHLNPMCRGSSKCVAHQCVVSNTSGIYSHSTVHHITKNAPGLTGLPGRRWAKEPATCLPRHTPNKSAKTLPATLDNISSPATRFHHSAVVWAVFQPALPMQKSLFGRLFVHFAAIN